MARSHVQRKTTARGKRLPTAAFPGVFLRPDGKLPSFAQRRLDGLIDKKKSVGLSRDEERELSEMLTYVNRKTMELLEYQLKLNKRRRKTPRKPLAPSK
jgi:hypothetical protein